VGYSLNFNSLFSPNSDQPKLRRGDGTIIASRPIHQLEGYAAPMEDESMHLEEDECMQSARRLRLPHSMVAHPLQGELRDLGAEAA